MYKSSKTVPVKKKEKGDEMVSSNIILKRLFWMYLQYVNKWMNQPKERKSMCLTQNVYMTHLPINFESKDVFVGDSFLRQLNIVPDVHCESGGGNRWMNMYTSSFFYILFHCRGENLGSHLRGLNQIERLFDEINEIFVPEMKKD